MSFFKIFADNFAYKFHGKYTLKTLFKLKHMEAQKLFGLELILEWISRRVPTCRHVQPEEVTTVDVCVGVFLTV